MNYYIFSIDRHPTADLSQWKYLWDLPRAKKVAMDKVWEERKKVPQPKKKDKQKKDELGPLEISEVHSSRLA